MKLKYVHFWPRNATKAVVIDREYWTAIRAYKWSCDRKQGYWRIRAWFNTEGTRQLLPRFVVHLSGQRWPEVRQANGDWWDCRLINLRPYDRSEDGSSRKLFKGRRQKGIYWSAKRNRWAAAIRVNRKLHFLGWHRSRAAAQRAWALAWNKARPHKAVLLNPAVGA